MVSEIPPPQWLATIELPRVPRKSFDILALYKSDYYYYYYYYHLHRGGVQCSRRCFWALFPENPYIFQPVATFDYIVLVHGLQYGRFLAGLY